MEGKFDLILQGALETVKVLVREDTEIQREGCVKKEAEPGAMLL